MAAVVRSPIYAPHPNDTGLWQGSPSSAAVLTAFSQPKMFNAGGQVPAKQWRYDHVPDPPWYPPVDSLNSPVLQQLTANVIPGSVFYAPRPPGQFDWNWSPLFPITGTLSQPFNLKWRYDLEDKLTQVETPSWFNWYTSAKLLTFPSGNPFSKLWRYDHVPDPPWNIDINSMSSSVIQAFTQPKYFNAGGQAVAHLWRWDHVPDPPYYPPIEWLNAATLYQLLSPKLFGAGGQVVTKLWRWDHVPDPPWYPPSEWLNAGTLQQLTANKQPFNRQWRYDIEDRTYQETPTSFNWFGSAKILTFPSNPPFSKLWRWDYVPEPPYYPPSEWLNSGTLQQLTAGGEPFSKQWRWDYVPEPPFYPPAEWLNAGTLQQLTEGGNPFHKQWRWDHVPDGPWYPASEWMNSTTIQLLTAGGEPFSKQWRWDQVEPPVWTYLAPAPPISAVEQPFNRQWRWDHVPEPSWLAESVPATTIINQLLFLYLPIRQWVPPGEQNMPLWTSTPQANVTLTGIVNRAFNTYQLNYVPEPPWYPPSVNSGAIELTYTQQTLFGQAGQTLTKQWRWDHVPEPPWYPASETLNSAATQQLTANAIPGSVFYAPRPPEHFGWVWTAPRTSINIATITTQPFFQSWHYDHVPEPPWYPTSGWLNSSQIKNIVGGNPFSKQWRWDYVPEPPWWMPIDWLNSGAIQLSNTQQKIYGVPGQVPTKQWRWDYVEQPPWWLPLQYLTATPAQYLKPPGLQPRPLSFIPLPPEQTYWNWFPPPLQAFALSQLELYSPSAAWQANVAEQVSWAWNPPSTELIKQLVVSQPFNRQWRYDLVEQPWWQVTAETLNSEALQILTAGGQPFSKLWRWDSVEQPIWSVLPPNASLIITTTAIAQPFNKQWRSDIAEWVGWSPAAEGLNSAAIQILTGGGKPFNKQWRWDLVEQPGWSWLMQNSSVQRFLTQSKVTSPQKLWCWDYVPEPPWYPPLDWLTSAVIKAGIQPVTFYGKPGQAPTKFWGGLYNYVPEPPWQYPTNWMNSQQFIIPLPPPPPPPPPPELGQVLTSPREIRALWVQPGVRTIVMPYLVRKILVREN